MIKKIVALFLVVLISINSMAAVVADNDGSAFITKAEFDSLKNSFQAQLDQYNTSIDNKIDSAIADYLSGIKVETTEELDSYLNIVNDKAEDFYLDASGNKVKYGYRCMARRYNIKTTQKPVGAITNLMMVRVNSTMDTNDSVAGSMTRLFSIARFSMNMYNRTAIGDVHVPKNGYQIGKYMMLRKRSDGTYYSSFKYDDVEYRYFVGGQSFTYDGSVAFPPSADPTADYNDNGTWTTDEMKNDDKYWGLKIANTKWVWEKQIQQEYRYDNMRTIFGGSFSYIENDEVFPLVSYTNTNVYALDQDRLPEMSFERLSETSSDPMVRDRILRLDRGLGVWQIPDMSKAYVIWHAPDSGLGDDNGPNGEYTTDDSNGGTVHWTFYFNHHPWQTINTKDLVDNNISEVLGRAVKLTSGIPVCKASMDGTIDLKIKFMGDASHTFACGWQKNEFEPNDSTACLIDSSLKLRDFNNVSITSNAVTVDDELEFRMDVKKGDTIWIRAVDTSDQYGFVGAKTTSIKNIAVR